MTRDYRHTEIIAGVLAILIGILALGLFFWHFISLNELVEIVNYSSSKFVLNFILKNLFPITLSLLLIFGGITFILRKRTGWILLTIVSSYYFISLTINLLLGLKENDNENIWIPVLTLIPFILILIFTLSKPCRKNNLINRKSILWVLSCLSILLIYSFAF